MDRRDLAGQRFGVDRGAQGRRSSRSAIRSATSSTNLTSTGSCAPVSSRSRIAPSACSSGRRSTGASTRGVDALAEVADHRRQFLGRSIGCAAIELLADLAQQRFERSHVGRRGGNDALGAEVAHHRFDRRRVRFLIGRSPIARSAFSSGWMSRGGGGPVGRAAGRVRAPWRRAPRASRRQPRRPAGRAFGRCRAAPLRAGSDRAGARPILCRLSMRRARSSSDVRVDRRRQRPSLERLVHALREILQTLLDRRQRRGGGRTFDLCARVGDERVEPSPFGRGRRVGGERSTRSARSAICFSSRSTGTGRVAAAASRLRTSSVWARMRWNTAGSRPPGRSRRPWRRGRAARFEADDGEVGVMGAQGLARSAISAVSASRAPPSPSAATRRSSRASRPRARRPHCAARDRRDCATSPPARRAEPVRRSRRTPTVRPARGASFRAAC